MWRGRWKVVEKTGIVQEIPDNSCWPSIQCLLRLESVAEGGVRCSDTHFLFCACNIYNYFKSTFRCIGALCLILNRTSVLQNKIHLFIKSLFSNWSNTFNLLCTRALKRNDYFFQEGKKFNDKIIPAVKYAKIASILSWFRGPSVSNAWEELFFLRNMVGYIEEFWQSYCYSMFTQFLNHHST